MSSVLHTACIGSVCVYCVCSCRQCAYYVCVCCGGGGVFTCSCRLCIVYMYATCYSNRKGESVVQSKSQKPKLGTIKHDHQMDGWPLCARLKWHPPWDFSTVQSLCRFYKSSLDEIINWGPSHVYTHANISHNYMHVQDHVVLDRIRQIIETTTQDAMKVWVFIMLKLDTIWKKQKKMMQNYTELWSYSHIYCGWSL